MPSPPPVLDGASHVTALLGPTNTGKTHRAIQRMLAHRTGMIGLPLRLLAREVYDRIVEAKGAGAVALVTGEEKRIPAEPRYFVCTVEAMPVDRPVAFLAVDEVQLAGDRSRGHVFTDRILRARGVLETMFLGASTMAPLLEQLVPNIRIESAPRLSRLSWSGSHKLTSLPRRSAVVAFSAEQVYETAERLRGVHGGTAVVLGALSPRTRNAQVAMYQSGEVQHLVATDAIGMGLNMDVHHVAFTATRKFDGRSFRELTPPELAQIAGRAGRYRTDGTFGTTREVGPLDADLIEALETHAFPPLTRLYWRNAQLDYSSPEALIAELSRRPPRPFLVPVHDEEDQLVLEELLRRDDVRERVGSAERLELLWEVCQVPDYRKTLAGSHTEMLHRMALHLLDDGRLPADWVADRLDRLDRTEGDLDALMTRIAWIRTWTYVAFQRGWLEDPAAWQARTRAIEDRLSDALHEQLTQRFVDRRVMMVIGGAEAEQQIHLEGDEATVGGLRVGRIRDLSFEPDPALSSRQAVNAVRRALRSEAVERVERLRGADDEEITIAEDGRLVFEGQALARLEAGLSVLEPRVRLLRLDLLDADEREAVRRQLQGWVERLVEGLLSPLRRQAAGELGPSGRGLVYRLEQGLGSIDRQPIEQELRDLPASDRKALAKLDVRIGTCTVFVHSLLKAAPQQVRAALWSVHHEERPLRRPPPDGRSALPVDGQPPPFLEAIGYRVRGGLAVRADVLEKVAARARGEARDGRPAPLDPYMSWMGCRREEAEAVLGDLGFDVRDGPEEGRVLLQRRRPSRGPRGRRR